MTVRSSYCVPLLQTAAGLLRHPGSEPLSQQELTAPDIREQDGLWLSRAKKRNVQIHPCECRASPARQREAQGAAANRAAALRAFRPAANHDRLQRIDVLICDELGFVPFDRAGGELLFNVFADRYERRSTIVTSNLAFSEWVRVFGDEKLTTALLDRLSHHAHILATKGSSYRTRLRSKAS